MLSTHCHYIIKTYDIFDVDKRLILVMEYANSKVCFNSNLLKNINLLFILFVYFSLLNPLLRMETLFMN